VDNFYFVGVDADFFTFVGEIFLTFDLTKKQSWKHFYYVFDHHFYVVILDALYEYVVERKKETKKKKKKKKKEANVNVEIRRVMFSGPERLDSKLIFKMALIILSVI
jgi:hypothetical protein